MTPADFLRSLTPGIKQPEGLGLDSFKKFDPATMKASNLGNAMKSSDPFDWVVNIRKQNLFSFVKFMFSKKVTKIDEIFTVDLTLCCKCQIDGEDFVNFCGLLRKHEL